MAEPPATFEIYESRSEERLRLSLHGELNRASVYVLEDRLASLRARRLPVRLNLSQLQFIDSTGIRVLARTAGEARTRRWDVEIERDLSSPVRALFRLSHLDHLVFDGGLGSSKGDAGAAT